MLREGKGGGLRESDKPWKEPVKVIREMRAEM